MTETIRIEGMNCGGCVSSVDRALGRLPLESARVELGRADVSYDETKVTRGEIVEAIVDAGFTVPATA